MKRALAGFLSFLLLVNLAVVPAYAGEPYNAAWVPPIPDFIRQTSTGCSFDLNFGDNYEGMAVSAQVKQWIEGLISDNATVICLLEQGSYNRYKEENGIDYDRQFSVYLVAPDKKANGTYYDLGSFMHKGGPRHQEQMNAPSPMRYMCLDSPHSFVKYVYDPQTNFLNVQPGVSHLPGGAAASLRFTYVLGVGHIFDYLPDIDNGAFSGSSSVYPYFTEVDGKDFGVGTAYHQFINGQAVNHWRDYDWWLGIEGTDEIPPYNQNFDIDYDTDGDGKPDNNVDTNGDGKPEINIDTDGDGKPDINIDTNGDGKPDINIDTNGDGKPDINIDTDGDGKPDINIDTNGDGKPDINIDTDGDGKADINLDTDGDGKADTNIDIDGDGRPDVNVKPGSGSSSGGSSDSGSSSSGSSSSGSSSSSGGNGGDETDPGQNPGGDSSGGNSSDKGSGPPDTWFEDSSSEGLTYDDWEFFDPFKFSYTPFEWDSNYNPLEGYEPGKMPDFPGVGDPNKKNYIEIPYGGIIKYKDFVIRYGEESE